VVILGEAIALVINAIIARLHGIAVGPGQGDEVDAADYPMVIAGPLMADQLDVAGAGFVEG
jgi:hypothetical protein